MDIGLDENATSSFVRMHDGMMKMAMNDAYNQQDLAHKAKLQVDNILTFRYNYFKKPKSTQRKSEFKN